MEGIFLNFFYLQKSDISSNQFQITNQHVLCDQSIPCHIHNVFVHIFSSIDWNFQCLNIEHGEERGSNPSMKSLLHCIIK